MLASPHLHTDWEENYSSWLVVSNYLFTPNIKVQIIDDFFEKFFNSFQLFIMGQMYFSKDCKSASINLIFYGENFQNMETSLQKRSPNKY